MLEQLIDVLDQGRVMSRTHLQLSAVGQQCKLGSGEAVLLNRVEVNRTELNCAETIRMGDYRWSVVSV